MNQHEVNKLKFHAIEIFEKNIIGLLTMFVYKAYCLFGNNMFKDVHISKVRLRFLFSFRFFFSIDLNLYINVEFVFFYNILYFIQLLINNFWL